MVRKFTIFVVSIFMKLFYHHKVYGKEHLSEEGGIIASNHSSFFDPPIVGISCPYEVHFLGRATLFHSALFSWLIRQLNTHPIAQGKGNIGTMRKCLELLNDGKKVAIFPEGSRSLDGTLQKGQLGVGMLVLKTKCQVTPVYIYGTYEIWNKGRAYPKLKGRTACVFGSPITFSHTETENKREAEEKITSKIMERIGELKTWYLLGARGSPP